MRIVVLALLTACSTAPTPAATSAVEMQTWELPDGQAERLVQSLNRVMSRGGGDVAQPVGKADEGPAGSLIVVAPRGVLDGVQTLVDGVVNGTPAASPKNVTFEYWVVIGTPAAQAERGERLDAVGPALDAIEGADGPQRFQLKTTRTLRSLEGEWGDLEDQALEARQLATVEPGTDTVVANLRVGMPYGSSTIETHLALTSGEIAVLAQTGTVVSPQPGERASDTAANVYLLVRPTIR